MADPMWLRTQKARKLLKRMAKRENIDMKSIVGRYQFSYLVDFRREFIEMARRDFGLGAVVIGRILNRNHSTIIYHTSPELRKKKMQRYTYSRRGNPFRDENGKFIGRPESISL